MKEKIRKNTNGRAEFKFSFLLRKGTKTRKGEAYNSAFMH
jgi:hypothetical protein